ncbi:thiol:disulfide interchange protein DsbA/DsbL [Methylobacter sp. S3L5C]|uniref:thiol:disulfide interchange protein DsbA/DsbL n=1 Tax=Methylobacter sp. S3L5C TaxID=2839024 RepID=UPI001FABE289|nr:thiol:disulfide interchange protein DsbA/DsbL [Methylobacter sp. S3L5C]UOA09764.1 thiol:disulfide interchange protein DsbA/DsbL [Methylobacter sp. S3L5C]
MLKKITQSVLLVLLLSSSFLLKAEPAVGYETLSPAQPTQNPDKIEVIEFFWYGCPHCYSFEPLLEKWAKNLPKNVEFIRQPAAFNELWSKHAKAYYTAEALGIVDKVHGDFFDAVQNKKETLDTEEALAKFFAAHGVSESQFKEAYNSFVVDAKMRQAPLMAARYGITGVPAVIINGKYKTNGTLAGSHEKMIEIINHLIKQESAKK